MNPVPAPGTGPGPAPHDPGADGAVAQHVVVVGGGMVAHRLVQALASRRAAGAAAPHVTVLAEEHHAPYDRVALTSFFSGRTPDDLLLGDHDLWTSPGTALRLGRHVTAVDRDRRTVTCTVTTAQGHALGEEEVAYDHLVLATGSAPFVPPVPGADLPGVFVYRTLEDVQALRTWVLHRRQEHPGRPVRAAVVGGGLLGLEAAGALRDLQADTAVVEFADRLMPLQVDAGGGQVLRRLVQDLGVRVLTAHACLRLDAGDVGGTAPVARMHVQDRADGAETVLAVDVVVVAAGVRPRDELARACGLEVGPRGGVMVDTACRTGDPAVSAVGEVAHIDGQCWGLVAPGYTMAEIVAADLCGDRLDWPGADLSTKLKLLGVDVASFGDAFATTPGALEVVLADPVAGTYQKLVLTDDARVLLGGVLVGDASRYASLRPLVGRPLEGDPVAWLVPEGAGAAPLGGDLPDDALVCTCNSVTAGAVRHAAREGCTDLAAVKTCTTAGTSCGSCLPLVKKLATSEWQAAGVGVSNALCEHFTQSRAQLFDIVRVAGITTFGELVARHGTGRGCDVCKPAVASILAGLGAGHVLEGEHAALQDTNDHVLANIQKDGTYSVVPRVPGGEITPEGLITIGEVARDFGLYTKITGGQRVDMFGARIDQLPAIWRRLVDAGFESGHAYGKSLRTVKSCVGSTWCRFGVQDAVGLAVHLELRYRGLRSPHKIKLGVSGCARECAEARGKDVGVIATENGWNVYVGGNGGFTPRHARLLAEDLDLDTLVRTVDRFLLYYVRTADRLQRTAAWLEEIEGGLEHVRAVVLDDSLGIAADLDAAMARHVENYTDEWRDVLDDPAKLARFASFVNAPDTPDPDLAYVLERGQRRPAGPGETPVDLHRRSDPGRSGRVAARTGDDDHGGGPVVVADARLEVRTR